MRKAKAVWHKNDDAVSPVIGTILMVAITVVLAAVLWLMVSGMLKTEESEKTTVNLASPQVSQSTTNTSRWDVRIDINKITPKDDKVQWTEVKIIVKSSTGSVLQAAIDVTADPITGYDGGNVSFYYVETGGDAKMGAGDGIKITSVDSNYEGATVELTKGGERIASTTLPTNFP